MANVVIRPEDLSIVAQNHQIRYVQLELLNSEMIGVAHIVGQLVSGNVSIESGDNIRRSASVTMKVDQPYIDIGYLDLRLDISRDIPANYFIKLWCGIEDNNTLTVHWYNEGVYIIDQSSYNFDPATGNLSLSLVDLMIDLNGDRAGTFHAYTSIVKNTQRIDETIKAVLELAGFTSYEICPITALKPFELLSNELYNTETGQVIDTPDESAVDLDYYIPYDLDFNAGVTAYEIIDKLVNLYPYYECGFDVDGMFFVRKELLEQDTGFIMLDAYNLTGLVLSEDTTINWSEVKNHVEVWGKDGNYFGEASDENLESPFRIGAAPLRTFVVTGSEYGIDTNTICDRYTDTSLADELLKKQASLQAQIATLQAKENPTSAEKQELQKAITDLNDIKWKQQGNISVTGDELARQWAERILYDKSRLNDAITIKTVSMPFINDVDFKMTYRSKVDDVVRTYVVKSVSHDLLGGTTDINMIRFYTSECASYWEQLSTPVITNAATINMDIVITIDPVPYAETYGLYIDGVRRGTYTGTHMVYSIPDSAPGTYSIRVIAEAPYYRSSELSEAVTVTVSLPPEEEDVIITDDGSPVATNDNYNIKYNEG